MPNLQIRWKPNESKAENLAVNGFPAPEPAQPLSETEAYARAAEKASPSVVNIDTTERVRLADDDWLFSDRPVYNTRQKQGSGVIIDAKEGYVLTNEHVVGGVNEENKRIRVTLVNGKQYEAVVVGADKTTDIALVKMTAQGLVGAKIGDVNALVPGQMVVAIGNPLGFRFTVTHGVISATKRPVAEHENLIQTDCAINPGNSGGALINLQGQVIGINTLIISRAQGIGFAIPMDTALRVAAELKQFGRIKRPWLGINSVITNNQQLSEAFGLANIAGAVIKSLPQGPARSAGMQPGDIILNINNKRIQTLEDYKAAEKTLKIGQAVEIELQRGQERGKGKITVGEAP
jgi:S1-C subfamily serine protease